MKGFVGNIEELVLANENFRKVVYTAKFSQLVLMTLAPKEEIGEEVHDVDEPLKLYTLYSPGHHEDGTVHPTKAEAAADSENFDGQTTE